MSYKPKPGHPDAAGPAELPTPSLEDKPLYRLPVAVLGGILVLLIRWYQFAIRPFLIGSCKFVPSCSEYAIGAVNKHGPWRGSLKAAWRLLRCHPFSKGGIDPP